MINRAITILYRGYDPLNLKVKSMKKVYVNCNQCGDGRWIRFAAYSNLCRKCASTGKNNSMYGICKFGEDNPFYKHKHNNKSKQKMRDSSQHLSGENSPNWKGGYNITRPHLTPVNRCIKLNTKFKGFDGHHIIKSVIIYLPRNLHSINWHDLKNNKNMNKINKIAMNYLLGNING